MTLAATLMVWPASAAYFGAISLAAPLATLFAVPILAPIMIAGSLSAFTGLLYLPLAQVIAWAVWLLTTYLLLVARVFSRLPYAAFDVQSPAVLIIATYYIFLMLVIIWLNRRKRMRFMAEMEII